MLSPWLLLPALFTVSQAFSFPKHSAYWTEASETPNCEELRLLWEYIRDGTSRHQQLTNEIPVIPVHAQPSTHNILKAFRNKSHLRKPSTLHTNAIFSNYIEMADPISKEPLAVQPPNYLVLPASPDEDVSGIFGEFHEQPQNPSAPSYQKEAEPETLELESPPAMTSGNEKNRDTEFYVPQWGLPEEVDTFGSFVDFDIGSSKLAAMTRTPKGDTGKWSEISRIKSEKSSQGTCDALINSDCTVTEQCVCVGWKKLACIEGKCLKYDQKNDIGRKYGTWHDGPIPLPQLKLMSRLRKRRYRSIFM